MDKHIAFGYHGDLDVLESIVKRNSLHDGKTITVIFGGGGQKVVTGAAIAKALAKHNLVKHIDNFLGVSAGNFIAYRTKEYAKRPYSEEEADRLIGVFFKENIENKLIDLYRWGNWIDIDTLGEFIKRIDYNFTEHKDRAPYLYIGYATKKTNAFHVASAHKHKHPLSLITNSMAVPFLSKLGRVAEQIDGYFENPVPLAFADKHLASTHTLMILTEPIAPNLVPKHKVKYACEKLLRKTLRPSQLRSFLTTEVVFDEEVSSLYHPDKETTHKTLVIYPTHMPITSTTMDATMLSHGAKKAFEYMDNLIVSLQ